ncbi:hypothetical protein SynWH8101_0859 [Synechococcus sp. WH 8101]|nr:hypothetical protein [Synechococcus sp. WH 8101]QBE68449.1 hypothetical protein SynWH8101_0859 [Synechococcus sp. WH 8101]
MPSPSSIACICRCTPPKTHCRNLSGKLGFKGAELVRYATLQSLQAHA